MSELRFTVIINSGNVKAIMRRRHCSYQQLAADLSTTVGYLYHLIGGSKTVSTTMGRKITTHPVFRGRRWDDIFKMEGGDGI